MDPFRVLLYMVTFLLYVVGPISSFRLCGRELADALAVVCKGRGYYIDDSEIAQKDSPIVPHHVASSFLGSSSASAHSRQRRRVRTGQIVNECCDKECSNNIMESYCNRRTPEVPPESAISENPSEEITEDSTLRTDGESTEIRTDTNPATNLEVPSPDANTPDATATSDVEQPRSDNTTAVEKPRKKDNGKGKNSSLESSTKKNRTSKGMSKEDRRRIASDERRASRERKKELSRERRKRLKLQQRKDKKKKKRLESAERNRGTDHMGLSEDSTLLAREPLGIDVRKRFHHTPRSSREQASTATHALDDDPATSRQERRRTQSRPSSRERKTHRTTTATAREEEMQRERRNVMQRLTGLFL
ncbi:pre-mRNA-splicing factor 38B [Strongylocentrotus purpuratus]|uniref:Insulin-like domain-containing protein n=1 Tax=Strongylocentrotus purpuratus TaxID=7668 RepID=A0A7M7GH24_STRPU|nr:pre-mRNA-splicing factor 38B [Strongylocentrotus purpuratus]XP_011679044.1 pre-mRNA-splicing factor 38B [Strongylocentrotus purpuratus]|eukprot:XP_003723758.1 PREDICTED: pre-mRNA-splicing factor 38B isoform X2 [Strongylocentrotus purpuratus]